MRAADWTVAALLALAFAPALLSLEGVWSRVEYYSHGYLVPLVALAAAWGERDALRGIAAARDQRGLALLGSALAAYALGLGFGSVPLQGLALVAAAAGAVWFLRGAPWLRQLAFPLGFLVFMVPLPPSWLTPLILQLRLFVTQAAVTVLHALRLPVLREGNVIELPGGGSLFVADACSGVTSIVTLTPLAVLLAYYTERSWLRRILLVASVVPIALLGNLGRVVGTVVAARRVGVEVATRSWVHEWTGVLTYVLGCLALLAVGFVLRRIPRTA